MFKLFKVTADLTYTHQDGTMGNYGYQKMRQIYFKTDSDSYQESYCTSSLPKGEGKHPKQFSMDTANA